MLEQSKILSLCCHFFVLKMSAIYVCCRAREIFKSHLVQTSAEKMIAVLATHFENSIAIHLVLNRAMMRLSISMQSLARKCKNGCLYTHLSLHLKLKVTCVYIWDNSNRCPGIIDPV